VAKAIKIGKLPELDGSVSCVDCGKPAQCYDHRNYYHALAVDPVCTGCNNRRGPGFPINPHGNEYRNESAKKLGFAGTRWRNVEEKKHKANLENQPENSVSEFYDEHWVTWEPDPGVSRMIQETRFMRSGRHYFHTSFLRGLYDWYGVQPI
jgi:hypothetical protein